MWYNDGVMKTSTDTEEVASLQIEIKPWPIPEWQAKMLKPEALELANALAKAGAQCEQERNNLIKHIDELKYKLNNMQEELIEKYKAFSKATQDYRPECFNHLK